MLFSKFNFVSTKFIELSAISLIKYLSFGEFLMKKHAFKLLCWHVNKNCDVDVAMDHVDYQS